MPVDEVNSIMHCLDKSISTKDVVRCWIFFVSGKDAIV